MEIEVSKKSEFVFVPDVFGNKDLPRDNQFKVVFRKLNDRLHSGKWTSFDRDLNMRVDMMQKLKHYVVKFINPPLLNIDGQKRELRIDDIVSESFPALDELANLLIDEMNRIAELRIDYDKKK